MSCVVENMGLLYVVGHCCSFKREGCALDRDVCWALMCARLFALLTRWRTPPTSVHSRVQWAAMERNLCWPFRANDTTPHSNQKKGEMKEPKAGSGGLLERGIIPYLGFEKGHPWWECVGIIVEWVGTGQWVMVMRAEAWTSIHSHQILYCTNYNVINISVL